VAGGCRIVWVIGAGVRVTAGEGARRLGGALRAVVAVVLMWWRSRGSGPPKTPIWSHTT
jgi:hypothetical protein